MPRLYLALAVLGAVIPYAFFIHFWTNEGIALPVFAGALIANGAVAGFTADLIISSVVFWILLWREQTRNAWVFVLLNLTIGLSCALPAWLYLRERTRSAESGV